MFERVSDGCAAVLRTATSKLLGPDGALRIEPERSARLRAVAALVTTGRLCGDPV